MNYLVLMTLFDLLKHYLDLYITDTVMKVSQYQYLCTVSLHTYLKVLKIISADYGVQTSAMLFLID